MFAVSTKDCSVAFEGVLLHDIIETMATFYIDRNEYPEAVTKVFHPENDYEYPESVSVVNEQVRNRYEELKEEDEEERHDDARYGSYDAQVRRTYYAGVRL